MKTFNIYIDTKVSVWKRDYLQIEAPSQEYMESILQDNITALTPFLTNPDITELTINKVVIKKEIVNSEYLYETEQIIEDEGNMEIYLNDDPVKCIANY